MGIKANSIYKVDELGLTINEKIIPDNTKWTNAYAIKRLNEQGDGTKIGDAFKDGRKLNGNGKVDFVTLHNTEDLDNISDDAAHYTLATYNQNMGWCRVHFYVDDQSIWQNLRAGTGKTAADPKGSAEVAYHSGDGAGKTSGNMTSLSIELVMNENPKNDEKAKDNAARLCAFLLHQHNLPIERLVTHTYWVSKKAGKTFTDVDQQCTNMIPGQKWCPCYIFGSTNKSVALKNWKAFKTLVKKYLDILNKGNSTSDSANTKPSNSTGTSGNELFRVQVGAYKVKANADAYLKTVQAKLPNAFVTTDKVSTGTIYRIQVGAYRVKANAENYLKSVQTLGFTNAFIVRTTSATSTVNSTTPKTVAEVAVEVIRGMWGYGEDRISRLKIAGYDPKVVQAEVNKLLNK